MESPIDDEGGQSEGTETEVVPAGRTARLIREGALLVAAGDTVIDDRLVFGLVERLRR